MLTIYTTANSKRCRDTTEWFCKNEIPFVEKRLDAAHHLSKKEIYQFLCLSSFGFEEIIAKRSKLYSNYFKKIDDMAISEVVDILASENSLIHMPILCDGKKVCFGSNEEGFRSFIPRERKKAMTMFYWSKLHKCSDI